MMSTHVQVLDRPYESVTQLFVLCLTEAAADTEIINNDNTTILILTLSSMRYNLTWYRYRTKNPSMVSESSQTSFLGVNSVLGLVCHTLWAILLTFRKYLLSPTTPATLPTATWYNNPRIELTSIISTVKA